MSDQQSNHKNEYKVEQNRDGNEETFIVDKSEPKGLNNICYDCLERIFDFLDLESLLNVAGTCRRLQIEAAAKFGHDWSTKSISLWPCYIGIQRFAPGFYTYKSTPDKLFVNGLKMHFLILRCFGAKISNLRLCYTIGNTSTQNAHLDEYINRYCVDTLKSVKFHANEQFFAEHYLKPFKNIEKVEFCGIFLEDQLEKCVYLFPKLRELQLYYVAIYDEAIAVSFPHLKHLELFLDDMDRHFYYPKNFFNKKNSVNFLRLNRQLQSLKFQIYIELSLGELLDLIFENLSISKLEIVGHVTVNVVEINRLANEHPLIEELIFGQYRTRLTVDEAVMFIRQLNLLKRFEFGFRSRLDCDCLLKQLDEKWQHKVSYENDHYRVTLNC